jgi:hypothetical protein
MQKPDKKYYIVKNTKVVKSIDIGKSIKYSLIINAVLSGWRYLTINVL